MDSNPSKSLVYETDDSLGRFGQYYPQMQMFL